MAKGAKRSVNIYVNSKDVEKSMKDLEQTINKNEREWKKLTRGTQEYFDKAKEIVRLKGILQQHKRDIMETGQKIDEMRKKWMDIGAGLGGFVQTINMIKQGLQVFRDVASEMAQLDDKMHLVKKTTGLSIKDIQDMNKELGKIDTRTSIENLDELAYAAGKLGKNSKEDVLGFVKAADQINVALGDVLGGTDAIIEIAKMTDIFSDGIKELEDAPLEKKLLSIGSIINELGKTSTANEKHITEFMGRLAGVAGQIGMTADQVAGYASVFDQYKQKVEMASTATQRMFVEMIKRPQEFAKAARMSLQEFTELMDKDFNQAAIKVLEGFSQAGGMQALAPAFKEMGLDGQRAMQAIASLATHVDKLKEAQQVANGAMKEATSVTKEYATMNESLQAQIEKGQKRVAQARRELGEKLYPVIVKFISLRGKAIKYISELSDRVWQVRLTLGTMVMLIANKMAPVFKNMIEKIKTSQLAIDLNTLAHRKEIIALEQKKIAIAKTTEAIIKQRIEAIKSVGASKITEAQINEMNRLREKQIILNQQVAKSEQKISNTNIRNLIKNQWAAILAILALVAAKIIEIVQENRKLGKTMEENAQKMRQEQRLANSLFKELQNINTSTAERKELLKIINSKYGEYLGNLRNEKGEIQDIATAMKMVNAELSKKWKLEAYNKGMEIVDENYNGLIKEAWQGVYKILEGYTGEGDAGALMEKIEELINDGKSLTKTEKIGANSRTYGTAELYKELGRYISEDDLKKINEKGLAGWIKEYERLLNVRNKEVERLKKKYRVSDNPWELLQMEQEQYKTDKEKEQNTNYSRNAQLSYEAYYLNDVKEKSLEELKEYEAELRQLENKSIKELEKDGIKNALEYSRAIANVRYRVSQEIKRQESGESIDSGMFGFEPSDEKAKKIEDKWKEILRKIKDLNDKYAIKESPVSSAKQQLIKDFEDMEKEVDRFVEDYNKHAEDAEEEKKKLKTEMNKQLARIDEEERKKDIEKIMEKLRSVEEKLAAWKLKMERKNMTQLEIDLAVIESDWKKGEKEIEEKIEGLQKKLKAKEYLQIVYDEHIDEEIFQNAMSDELAWLEEYGITTEKLIEWIKVKQHSLETIIAATKTGLSKEEEDTMKQLQKMEEQLEKSKKEETWGRVLETIRNIGYEVMSEGKRVKEERLYAIEQEIREAQAALKEARERNDKENIKKIEEIIAKLLKQKEKVENDFDTSLNGFFGIGDEEWKDWKNNWESNIGKITDVIDNLASHIMNTAELINQYESQKMEEQLNEMQENYNRRAEVLEKQLNNGLISQKYYDAQMDEMERKKEEKEKKLRHDQFERERKASLASIAIQGAIGIARIWAQTGIDVIYKAVLTTIQGAETAIQMALVANQVNPYYKGGYVRGQQLMLAGERGDEWVASNKLLRDKKTAPIIAAMEDYQRGKTREFRINKGGVNEQKAKEAAQNISMAYSQESNKEMLYEIRMLRKYLEDPRNRRTTIDRRLMLQFEESERQLKNKANI